MATHRPHDTGFAPEFEFEVAMDVLDASEDLAARHRPVTPHALVRRLSARPSGPRPTLAQIKDALAQVRRWRDQFLTRDLLQHRRQIVELHARVEAEQRCLSEDAAYLTVMLRETDAILHRALTAPGEADALSTPASARESRPLQ
jgi:hypothetical protein